MPVLCQKNIEVWRLYQTINTQFVYDFQAIQLVFNVYAFRLTQEEAKDMLDKLILIHGILTQRKDGAEEQNSD